MIRKTSNLLNLHTHARTHVRTHAHAHALTLLWRLNRFICSEMLLTADSHCIWFRYAKASTRWKKLIIFSKEMAVAIYNHPSILRHWHILQGRKWQLSRWGFEDFQTSFFVTSRTWNRALNCCVSNLYSIPINRLNMLMLLHSMVSL